MQVDYIIVGLGLAGTAFAEELEQYNKSFIVFEDASQTSSLVAGGTYNPVILKRFTPVWNAKEQLSVAIPFYKNLEEKLAVNLDTKFKTKKIFTSIADENNWFAACDNPLLSEYLEPIIFKESINGIASKFGYGIVNGTGWIDTKKLISRYKKKLEQFNIIIYESFNYEKLHNTGTEITYKEFSAKKIVFCEGFGLKKNPFFNYLPLNGTKGETLTIYAPDLQLNDQIKAAIFILPIAKDTYKVGATFNWKDKTLNLTKQGKQELTKKLSKVITVPYKIIKQSAGIRPTVKDRKPLVGVHKNYKNLAILNGLGTRGVMIAPIAAKQLYNLLENKVELPSSISINRF